MKHKICTVAIFLVILGLAVGITIPFINMAIFNLSGTKIYTNLYTIDDYSISLKLPDNWSQKDDENGIMLCSNDDEEELYLEPYVSSNVSVDYQWAAFLLNIKDQLKEDTYYNENSIDGINSRIRYVEFPYGTNYYITGLVFSDGNIFRFVYTAVATVEDMAPLSEVLASISIEKGDDNR